MFFHEEDCSLYRQSFYTSHLSATATLGAMLVAWQHILEMLNSFTEWKTASFLAPPPFPASVDHSSCLATILEVCLCDRKRKYRDGKLNLEEK